MNAKMTIATTGEEAAHGSKGIALPLSAALLGEANIEDCAVLARAAAGGRLELAAYAVLAEGFGDGRFAARVAELLPPGAPACLAVPVTHLPLTAGGGIDTEALASLPAVDGDGAARWQAALATRPEIGEAVVAVRNEAAPPRRLHRFDLPLTSAAPARRANTRRPAGASPKPSGDASAAATPSLLLGEKLEEADDEPATLPALLRRAAA
jgi:hypothetical protein